LAALDAEIADMQIPSAPTDIIEGAPVSNQQVS